MRPTQDAAIGSKFRVQLRPNFRLGIPDGNDWRGVLKHVSMRADFAIFYRSMQVISGECEVQWELGKGLSVSVEIEVTSW